MSLLDHIIFREYRSITDGLPIFRVIFALYILLVEVPRYDWIADFSDAFFSPPLSLAIFYPGFPPAWFFHLVHFGIILAALSLLVGYRTRWASLAVGILLILGNTWAYSFGKINHDILPIVVALVLAFSTWDRPLGKAEEPQQRCHRAWPLALLALLISLAMLSSAGPKVASEWLDPNTLAAYGHVLRQYYVVGAEPLLTPYLVGVDSPLLWKSADYLTVFVEAAMVLAVIHHRGFRIFCALAALFHLGVFFTMGLRFPSNLIAYAAFINWALLYRSEVANQWLRSLEGVFDRLRWPHLLTAAVGLTAFYAFFSNPWAQGLRTAMVWVGAAVAIAYLVWELHHLARRLRSRGAKSSEHSGSA